MIREQSLPNVPSIQNIIIQDKTAKIDQQIKSFFRPVSYSTFPTAELVAHPCYASDQRFYLLVRELQDWNKKVQNMQLKKDSRAQLYRNTFLFTSLKNIIAHGSKGSQNYEVNLNKLYEWWRINSKDQIPLFFSTRKRNRQDEDWQVRKTFKSNMHLELKNYQRRAILTTQDCYDSLDIKNNKVETPDKLVDYSTIKEHKSKQLKIRNFREQQQIQKSKSLLKQKQSKLNLDSCKNSQYFKNQFYLQSKTSNFFYKNQKSHPNLVKNSQSFSLLSQQTAQIENIKKYRLNWTMAKKGAFFRDKDLNMNKTAKSFVTSKRQDQTMSDLNQTLMSPQNFASNKKHLSIKIENSFNQNPTIKEEKQNTLEDFVDFSQLKNWQGPSLISNPFEHKKKPAKKYKKA